MCRLPHAHSSCLPTTESPGGEGTSREGTSRARSSQRRARLGRVSPPSQSAPAALSALANICFFIPGKEREQRPWKKLNQISTPKQLFPHDGGVYFPDQVLCTPCSRELCSRVYLNLLLQSDAGHREAASPCSRNAPRLSASIRASKMLKVFALN